ncbi:RagB/SusD family nutrient uptake outer membrane protein [Mucilaginibacter paludis]|uniref:RagB/SusD domain-containing protein n=1 Tax=Mucilaginibacter paludis DSM 18603 TaxID=714943 RepID=H1YDR9_9SPHI|nr:RagB/SusD family nutrient uptake outer membrane protein [Mucilaginibacter paludis]EHQ30758.1 RagB/SusD domain-containing protein [Mucilaginibacter paludis DSM 18603]
MKKYITLLFLLLVMGASCKKDYIALEDPTKISTADLYSDANGLGLAVTAAYGTLQDIYGKGTSGTGMYLFTDVPSDNSNALVSGAGLGDFDLFTVAPENVNLSTQWQNFYKCIARCNAIIGRAPGIDMTATLRDRYIAEAKFLRALSYFNAVRIWGGVPLVTKEIQSIDESLSYKRETVANVYAQIEKDLTDAETVLPTSYATADLGRATNGAAKAILGKVYLTEGKYGQCKTKLAELLPRGTNAWGYDLLPLYSDIFSTSNELNKETIFAVRYTKGGFGTGSPFFNWFVPNQSGSTIATVGGGSGFNTIMPDLYDAFPATDPRRGFSIASYVSSGVTYYYTKKYTDVPANAMDSNNDWIVIRYADVMLMYAEAENELNGPAGAISYVNDVRRRAYGNTTNDLTATQTSSQGNMKLAIETERRLELNMEGHRWFDLLRTGRAIDVMNASFTKYQTKNGTVVIQISAPHNLLFPIPLREIQINPNLTPNP